MKSTLYWKTKLTFYQICALAIIFFSCVIFFSIKLFPKIILLVRSLLSYTELVCNCTSLISFLSNPFLFVGYLFTGFLIVLFFIYSVFRGIVLKINTRLYIQERVSQRKIKISYKLQSVVKKINLENRVIEIMYPSPVVFCFGFLKPKICISSQLVESLNHKELIAVLLHEKQHLLGYDPARLFVIKCITSILFFLPGIRYLAKQYKTYLELYADHNATSGFRYKSALAKALYKVMSLESESIIKKELALSHFSIIINERINALFSKPKTPKFKILNASFHISLISIIMASVFMYNLFFSTSKASTSLQAGKCEIVNLSNEEQCLDFSERACNIPHTQENLWC